MTPRRTPARPEFRRAPAAFVAAFQRAVAGMSGITTRPMFDPAAFVTGKMFAGLFQDVLVLRLSADRAELERMGARPFEPMPGRPMRDYVVAPATVVAAPAQLNAGLARAEAYARAVPAKPKRPSKR